MGCDRIPEPAPHVSLVTFARLARQGGVGARPPRHAINAVRETAPPAGSSVGGTTSATTPERRY